MTLLALMKKIHKSNLEKIKAILAEYKNSDILLCYGVVLKKRKYLQKCLDDILSLCNRRNIKCLDAITKDGYPPHPSRKSKTIKIIYFKIKNDNKQSAILAKILANVAKMQKMYRQKG